MAEQTLDTGVAAGNGQTPPITEPTAEDLKAQLAEKDILLEQIKKAQSGSDAAVTAQKKELEELRNSLKERMTEEERKTAEAEELKKTLSGLQSELENIRAESRRKDLEGLKLKTMTEKKLNLKYADFISGNTEQEIIGSIEKFEMLHSEELKSIKSGVMDHGEPAKGNPSQSNVTQEDFKKMTYSQRVKLQVDNPELYEKLSK